MKLALVWSSQMVKVLNDSPLHGEASASCPGPGQRLVAHLVFQKWLDTFPEKKLKQF